MRLGYVGSATAHEHSLAWWQKNGQDPDRALHLVRTWAWSPWLQECQQRLGHALHERTPLPNAWKEAAIVRVCGRVASDYELFHHVPLARAAGLEPTVIDVALDPEMRHRWELDPLWQDLLLLVDAIDDGAHLSRAQWEQARTMMTVDQLVALNAVVGYWRTNARLALACELDPEAWMHPDSDTRPIDPGAPRAPFVPNSVTMSGQLECPRPAALTARALQWQQRSAQHMEPMVHLWSWVEDVQVANQRWWECLEGDDLALTQSHRLQVSLAACDRVSSRLSITMSECFPGVDQAEDRDLTSFLDRWDAATPLDPSATNRLLAHVGKAGVVESQVIFGFVGTQARLMNLAEGPT